jgi:hypothetical protein
LEVSLQESHDSQSINEDVETQKRGDNRATEEERCEIVVDF